MLKHRLTLTLLVLLIFILPQYPQQTEGKLKSRKALEKSLIYPGWGQIYEKQYFKGILFMAAETYCILQFILKNNEANQFYDQYRLADNSNDAIFYRQETERLDKARNTYILAGLTVWIANLVDIFLFTKKKYKKKGVSFFLNHEKGNKICFGFNICF